MEENGKSRRKFDHEFKTQAVKLLEDSHRPMAEVAQSLGVGVYNLSRWKRELARDGKEAFPGMGRLKPTDEVYRKLERELANVKMERDILKKALAVFSRATP